MHSAPTASYNGLVQVTTFSSDNALHYLHPHQQQSDRQQPLPGAYPYHSRAPDGTIGIIQHHTPVRTLDHYGNTHWDITKMYNNGMAQYMSNPVGALQERFQSRGITPTYRVVQAEGASHCPTFSYQVFVADLVAMGSGSSKKQAKHNAARAMLDKLDGRAPAQDGIQPMPPVDTSAIGPGHSSGASSVAGSTCGQASGGVGSKANAITVHGNTIGELQELCVHEGLPMPMYDVIGSEGQPHQRNFKLQVRVGDDIAVGEGTSKKDAKREAAAKLLSTLRESGKKSKTSIPEASIKALEYIEDAQEDKNNNTNEDTDVNDLLKRIQKLHLNRMTPEYMDKIKKFFSEMAGSDMGNKLGLLQAIPIKSISNCQEFLEEIAKEQNFIVTYVKVEQEDEDDDDLESSCQIIVQMALPPVAVCFAEGSDEAEAKEKAARSALNYLKIVAKPDERTSKSKNSQVKKL